MSDLATLFSSASFKSTIQNYAVQVTTMPSCASTWILAGGSPSTLRAMNRL